MSATTDAKTKVDAKPPHSYIFAPAGGVSHSKAAQYTLSSLSARSLGSDPIDQFETWFSAATRSEVFQPETCTLSTANKQTGRVSARMVYMKELDARGWVIYSNFGTSSKRRDLLGEDSGENASDGNSWASLTFWWREVERQVRVEGRTERLSDEESMRYYRTRERGSRIGAWASMQSEVLSDVTDRVGHGPNEAAEEEEDIEDGRSVLEKRVKAMEMRFEGVDEIPLPGFWGGLRIKPESVEFWQGRPSRLHDRFRYSKMCSGDEPDRWKIERLSP